MSSNICENQNTFNKAFSSAVKNYNDESKLPQGSMVVYLVIMILFLIWALVLAFQLKKGNERLLHLLFALIASPIYVIAYYLNSIKM